MIPILVKDDDVRSGTKANSRHRQLPQADPEILKCFRCRCGLYKVPAVVAYLTKLTSVFHASVLLFIMNFIIPLSK